MTDLSYPIFKLRERLDYERECLTGGVEAMRPVKGSSEKGIEWQGSDDDARRRYDACKARADQCEAAIAILEAAQ